MQGLFVDGARRPKSKKQIKELIAERPQAVYIEATSMFGNEFDGAAIDLPEGSKAACVGPDPYTDRRFYLIIERTSKGLRVT